MSKSPLFLPFASVKFKSQKTNKQIPEVCLHLWKMVRSPFQKSVNGIVMSAGDIVFKKCASLSNGKMIFTEPDLKLLQIYDETGSKLHNIYLSGRPFDLTVISDKLIAISYGEARYVEILNLKTQTIIQNFHWDINCFGIAYHNGELYVVIEGRGIVAIDYVSGQTIRTLPVKINQKSFLLVTDDGVIYTNWIFNTVHCHDFEGKEKWLFRSNKLTCPTGITADINGNVFVAGNVSGNILYIASDGKRNKEIERRPGLFDVHLDIANNRLLALTSNGSAFKYFVQFK